MRTSPKAVFAVAAIVLALLSVPCLQAKTAGETTPPATQAGHAQATCAPNAPNCDPQRHRRDVLLIEFLCAAAVLLVLYPIGRFLFRPWKFRAAHLFGQLAGDPIVYYYLQFRPGRGPQGPPPPKGTTKDAAGNYYPETVWKPYLDAFRKDFYQWYGRRYYIAPLILLVALTGASACWAQKMLRAWAFVDGGPGTGLRALTASALAGAFVWIISDEIDRLRRRDFTTSDIYYYVFRILLCVPFAWALAFVKDTTNGTIYGIPAAIPLAFFLGSFPTKTLFMIARRIGTQQLKLGDDQQTGNELEKLQGVTKSNAERFRDEGVTTIAELAWSDPIDLTIRTNFDFNYVVDCVSQALAWIYLGTNCVNLAAYSMRGAQEIASLIAEAANPATEQRANATIDAAAALLKIDKDAFRSTLLQIAGDPYTEFLVNVWG
jgi:hypothetical protein